MINIKKAKIRGRILGNDATNDKIAWSRLRNIAILPQCYGGLTFLSGGRKIKISHNLLPILIAYYNNSPN